jgi:branched-chain amino acid aminotransferase
MQETSKIWMNGELVDWADATVHVGTHGLHYGSGVFEGIRAYETPRGTAAEVTPVRAVDDVEIGVG